MGFITTFLIAIVVVPLILAAILSILGFIFLLIEKLFWIIVIVVFVAMMTEIFK